LKNYYDGLGISKVQLNVHFSERVLLSRGMLWWPAVLRTHLVRRWHHKHNDTKGGVTLAFRTAVRMAVQTVNVTPP